MVARFFSTVIRDFAVHFFRRHPLFSAGIPFTGFS